MPRFDEMPQNRGGISTGHARFANLKPVSHHSYDRLAVRFSTGVMP